MQFNFYRLRFHLLANEPIRFPPGKPGNILRGAFGTSFQRIACRPGCRDARTCEIRHLCPYARAFEPILSGRGPSGFLDYPRPFVFRAGHLDGVTAPPETPFHFDLHVFQLREPVIPYFIQAFEQIALEGLGPGRGRATLVSIDTEPLSIRLDAPEEHVTRLRVRFLTPTELKSGQQIAAKPEFGILMARIRDRLSGLSSLYGPGPLEMDFAAFGKRAAAVRLTQAELDTAHVTRLSTRTGQRHPLDGFTGAVEYEGDLTEFIPFLTAAQFTGVGRQTTWGKGEIRVGSPR